MNQLNGAGKTAPRERSTGELVKLLTEQVSVLVRDELRLAQLEMTRKGKEAGSGIGMMGGGGLIADQGKGATVMATAHDARQLKAEIEQTRERLGATVEQLAAKADVKSRARAKATDVAGRAGEHWLPLSLGAAGAVMLVTAYLAWQWRKR
jgi:hypothetical protein